MSFSDSLKVETLVKGPKCSICTLLTTLDKADHDALVAAMADSTVTATAIMRALRREGHNVNDSSIRRHARGACLAVV